MLDMITRKPEKSIVIPKRPEDYNINKNIETIYDIFELVYIDRVFTRIRGVNAVNNLEMRIIM
jgi:hypothetical protein